MAYEVRLKEFEGPLDLLLHLISKAKIKLEDIFVSQITEQYLEYMAQIPDIDMDKASAFLETAATLIYIKSRSLVPKRGDDEEEEADPETLLIERLKAYRAYKEVSLELKSLEREAAKIFFKLPEEHILPPQKFHLENVTIGALYDAFLIVLEREPKKSDGALAPVTITKDVYTVQNRIQFIRRMLEEKTQINFLSLFDDATTKLEVVVTFIALLEMLHESKVVLKQKKHFQDIMIVNNQSKAS